MKMKGPKGVLERDFHELVNISLDGENLWVKRSDDTRNAKALQGLTVRLIQNMLKGVTDGFEKALEIIGVGYKAEVKGKELHLSLGYSHPVIYSVPEGIEIVAEKPTLLKIRGINKENVGQVAAEIRAFKKPDNYKGKGIRYEGEYVKKKAGKSAVGSGF